jgi:Zn-dependent protease
MTLPDLPLGNTESLRDDLPQQASPTTSQNPASGLANFNQVLLAIQDLYLVQDWREISRPLANKTMRAAVFQGKLVLEAEAAYPQLVARLRPLGHTPTLERADNGLDILTVYEGVMAERSARKRPQINLLLFLITVMTIMFSAAWASGYTFDAIMRELERGNFAYISRVVVASLPFTITLLAILGTHEMGHYFAARHHGVDVTLPFFIPFFGIIGTMGAAILIRSPLNNRRALFDVGVSGPLAGFVVACIAMVIGFSLPPTNRPNLALYETVQNERLGLPLLMQVVGQASRPDLGNLPRFVARQPVAFAAWFGFLLTMLNLLPLGQLDGGHLIYTLTGRLSYIISPIVFAVMVALGFLVFPSFLFYALMGFLTGLRHPPPANDITRLDPIRYGLGIFMFVIFFLIATVTPFTLS